MNDVESVQCTKNRTCWHDVASANYWHGYFDSFQLYLLYIEPIEHEKI